MVSFGTVRWPHVWEANSQPLSLSASATSVAAATSASNVGLSPNSRAEVR